MNGYVNPLLTKKGKKANKTMDQFIDIKFAEGTDGHAATIRIAKIDAVVRPVLGAPYILVNGHAIKISESDAERITTTIRQ
ncbi:MAG: hypothetical protein QF918_14815 [Pirellulaceae bacterium]|nr:hypothetical protein [Pirellulaceae bacterium]MDP6555918.1 hypothetical protein [Pirellulaceae bacterium]MDP6717232.1 hypothetical protein [Pirellulaceae bacterium]